MLGILVRAVREKIPDASGEPGNHVEHKLRELFGRITAKVVLSCYKTKNTFLLDFLQNFLKEYRCLDNV